MFTWLFKSLGNHHPHHDMLPQESPWLSLATRLYRPSPPVGLCPPEYVVYELVLTSPAVSCMSSLSNLDSFRDGR